MHKIEGLSSSWMNKWQHHEASDIIRNLYFIPPMYVKWKECTYKDFPLKVVEGIGERDLQIHKGKALYEVKKDKSVILMTILKNFEES